MPFSPKSVVRKKFQKVLCATLSLILICSTPAVVLASQPQVGASPGAATGAGDADKFRSAIESAVSRAFEGLADRVAPKVAEVIAPEVDKINEQIAGTIAQLKEKKDSIEVNGFKMDSFQYPDADVIARIPEIAIGQVRSEVQASVRAGIEKDFEESKTVIQEQVKSLAGEAAPQLKEQIVPVLKAIVPKIHAVIEDSIEASIEDEIIKILPEAMQYIPEDMAKLSPEEIAAKMKAQIKPRVESTVRPEFEAKIKKQVNDLMIEKVKKPIEVKFQPRLLSMDASAYDVYVDQMPSYLERVISKDYIKSVVHENIMNLQAQLPAMVESSRAAINEEISAYIDNVIEKETKIYIGNALVEADVKPRIINSRLMIPFRAIASSLGAEVDWQYKTSQVVMRKNGTEIKLKLGSDEILVNGKTAKIDVAAQSIEGRTMVPVRFISETFGMDVSWQPDWKMVNMTPAK